MDPHYIFFALFAVAAYFIVTDESVAAAFYYVIGIITNYIRGKVWWATNDPSNPVVKYMIYRKNLKLAKELKAKIDKYYEENK
jgi:hypothetical protein